MYVLPYFSISSVILNYQPKNNYLLSQDVLPYLSISSAILNYQPKFNLNDFLTLTNANILFNANVSISSSIGSFNKYIIDNNLYISSLSSLILYNRNLYNTYTYNNDNTINTYTYNNNIYIEPH